MVRNHRLQDIKDFDETKKQKQIFQSSEMEKKLQEFQARKTIEEDKQKKIEFPILNEEESVKGETNTAEDTTFRDKSKKKETEVIKEKQGKGAVTETQHLPEMAADMHKEKMIKQEGNQAFLPPNPLEDYSEADNDISGYEDEYSVGIDLPLATEITSGNVTPIPTTGELEELSSVEDLVDQADSGRSSHIRDSQTSLRSLLKKTSLDNEEIFENSIDKVDGNVSPRKVHFSDIDQVKLLSQDSSPAASDVSDTTALPITMCKTFLSSTPSPSMPTIISTKISENLDADRPVH